jgi:hypothetical protein
MNYPLVKGIQVSPHKGPGSLQRGNNRKKCKNEVGSFKNHLLQNHWANFNQTWYRSSLVGRFQVCSNEGDNPSPRGDNSKRVEIH